MIEGLRPGLYRWEARHPAWEPDPEPESPDDWPQYVGCTAVATGGRFVVIDPQVPDDAGAFWREMDALVAEHGPQVTVLKTMRFHRRSSDDVVARYGAERPPIESLAIDGVETIPIADADETMIWLPELRALVTGDRVMGDGAGGLRMCPESWLEYLGKHLGTPLTLDGLRERLRPLLDLPVEMVLVSHGEPVLRDGRAALERALGDGRRDQA